VPVSYSGHVGRFEKIGKMPPRLDKSSIQEEEVLAVRSTASEEGNGVSPAAPDKGSPAFEGGSGVENCERNEHAPSGRALPRWNFVRSLYKAQLRSKQRMFKGVDKTSLTTAEANFLNMLTKSRLDGDHEQIIQEEHGGASAVGEEGKNSASTPIKGTSHFSNLIQAVVAKEALR